MASRVLICSMKSGCAIAHCPPLRRRNQLLEQIYGIEPLDCEAMIANMQGYGARLAPHVVDCTAPFTRARPAKTSV